MSSAMIELRCSTAEDSALADRHEESGSRSGSPFVRRADAETGALAESCGGNNRRDGLGAPVASWQGSISLQAAFSGQVRTWDDQVSDLTSADYQLSISSAIKLGRGAIPGGSWPCRSVVTTGGARTGSLVSFSASRCDDAGRG